MHINSTAIKNADFDDFCLRWVKCRPSTERPRMFARMRSQRFVCHLNAEIYLVNDRKEKGEKMNAGLTNAA